MGRPDTRQFWKRELGTLVQHLVAAWVAGLVVFFLSTAPGAAEGEYAAAINIGEAWRNYRPLFYGWLTVFAVLAGLRVLALFAVKRLSGFR